MYLEMLFERRRHIQFINEENTMLVSLKKLSGSTIKATDGDLGQVKDVYFDDKSLTIRFLVVDTHPWYPLSQKVLISPIALLEFSSEDYALTVSLSKDMVRCCPKTEEHETVSREFEKAYSDYFGYGYYWTGEGSWGEYAYPTALFHGDILPFDRVEFDSVEDGNIEDANVVGDITKQTNHLRSANEVEHYGINAIDGKKGYIFDFIWDTYNWTLRYLVIDTRNWFPGGKHVLVSPEQFDTFNWGSKTVTCNIGLEQIKACPEYRPDKLNDIKYLEEVRQKLHGIK
ncbi:MAG: sporulation protein YlmC with PRC-barrel domain [Paraglaciecola sp.]|jgi:sporulation protein YlmC with PRC-barrel domain